MLPARRDEAVEGAGVKAESWHIAAGSDVTVAEAGAHGVGAVVAEQLGRWRRRTR